MNTTSPHPVFTLQTKEMVFVNESRSDPLHPFQLHKGSLITYKTKGETVRLKLIRIEYVITDGINGTFKKEEIIYHCKKVKLKPYQVY